MNLILFVIIFNFSLTACYLNANISGADKLSDSEQSPSAGSKNQSPLIISGSIDDGIYNFSNTQSPSISLSIAVSDQMAFNHYEIAIGSSSGASDILTWTNIGSMTATSFNGLNLSYGQNYYPSIRAIDNSNNSSNIINGNGWVALEKWQQINKTTHTFLDLNAGVADIAEDSNHKIYLAGYFTNTGYPSKKISKIDLFGNRFTGFNQGTGFDNRVYGSALQSDEKILAVGWFNSYNGITANHIVRINSDGSIDSSFNSGTGFNYDTFTVAVQADGKILVGGDFTLYNGTTYNGLIRLNTNGSIDSSFNIGTGFNNTVNKVFVQSDGKIVVGGYFTSVNGAAKSKIVRLNSDGSVDWSFSIGTGATSSTTEVTAIAQQSDGKLIIGGSFTAYNGTGSSRIARLNTNGSLDATFSIGTGFDSTVYDIVVQPDGKILVAGNFSTFNGSSQNRLVRLLSTGAKDTGFDIGSGFDAPLYSLALLSDGRLFVAGEFSTYKGNTRYDLVLLNSDGSESNSFTNNKIYDWRVSSILLTSDNGLVATGFFNLQNWTNQSRLLRLNQDESIDSSFSIGSGFNSSVTTLQIQSDNKIVVGGGFTTYKGLSQKYIARLLSDGSLDSSFNIGTGFDNTVIAMALQPDGKILVGGIFTNYNGTPVNRIVRLNSNGSIDSSFNIGTGFNNQVSTINYSSTENKVYVGGNFTAYNMSSINRIIRLNLDGSIDSTFNVGTGFDGNINVIYFNKQGSIYIGGSFTTYKGSSANSIVNIDTNGNTVSSFNVNSGFDNFVSTISETPDGKLIVGGNFLTYKGGSSPYVIVLNTDGSKDAYNNFGAGFSSMVLKIKLLSNQRLSIGGYFDFYDNQLAPSFLTLSW